MQDWINSDTEGVYMYVLYLVKGSMQYPIHETKTTTKQLIYTGNIQQHQRNTDSKTPENSLRNGTCNI